MAGNSTKNSTPSAPKGDPNRLVPHQWQKGQSGNPSGRPTQPTLLSKAYKAQLAQPYPGDPEGRTYAAVIAQHVCRIALSPKANESLAAVAELTDRTEGKAPMSLSVGRQEQEQVSILDLINAQFDRRNPSEPPVASIEGDSGQLAARTTDAGSPPSNGGEGTAQ